MRGCLVFFLVLVLSLGAVLWIALPAGATFLAVSALRASGVDCANMDVHVVANPPLALLVGHADSLRLSCSDVTFSSFAATGADVTFGDVSLLSREVQTVEGTFDTVLVDATSGDPTTVEKVTISGFAASADAELLLSTAEARRLAEGRLASATGIHGTVTFATPDRVQISAVGQQISGRLVIVAGAVMLRPDAASFATIPLVEPGKDNPFTFHALSIAADGVHLSGSLDVASLLTGG